MELFHLSSELILVLDRDLYTLPFCWLFILLFFSIYSKRTKNLSISIPVSIFSFVDGSLFVSQEKSYKKSNATLFCSYSIILSFFNQLSLAIKHDKSEVFHFSRSTNNINLPPLDLESAEGAILRPKDIW